MSSAPKQMPSEGSPEAKKGPAHRARGRAGPKIGDIHNLSVLLRVWGGLILLFGLLVTLGTAWGLVGVGLGAACVVAGGGLARYRDWAWFFAVAFLVPVHLAISAVMLVFIGLSGIVTAVSVGIGISGLYVAWVLLSRGGRERYRRNREALEAAMADPRSALGRAMRRE